MNTTTYPKRIDAEAVARRLEICLPSIRLDRATPPAEQGLDSLDLVSFLCAIDQEFGVRIATDEFEAAESIDQLYALIAERSQSYNPE